MRARWVVFLPFRQRGVGIVRAVPIASVGLGEELFGTDRFLQDTSIDVFYFAAEDLLVVAAEDGDVLVEWFGEAGFVGEVNEDAVTASRVPRVVGIERAPIHSF